MVTLLHTEWHSQGGSRTQGTRPRTPCHAPENSDEAALRVRKNHRNFGRRTATVVRHKLSIYGISAGLP